MYMHERNMLDMCKVIIQNIFIQTLINRMNQIQIGLQFSGYLSTFDDQRIYNGAMWVVEP